MGLLEMQRLTSLADYLQAEKLHCKAPRLRLTSATSRMFLEEQPVCLLSPSIYIVCMSPVRSHGEAPVQGEMVWVELLR